LIKLLKEAALDPTLWRNRFGRGYGPVVRQNGDKKYSSIKVITDTRDICSLVISSKWISSILKSESHVVDEIDLVYSLHIPGY
jgi:hypothetical protein